MQQKFTGTKAEEAAKLTKLIKAQAAKPKVKCEGHKLNNVFKFKYLGSIFLSEPKRKANIKREKHMLLFLTPSQHQRSATFAKS